jgi:hypothetical protein
MPVGHLMEKNCSQKIIVHHSLPRIRKTSSIKLSVTRSFHPKKLIFGATYTLLAKYHQNSGTELLHHRVLKQSSFGVEWSHIKHALNDDSSSWEAKDFALKERKGYEFRLSFFGNLIQKRLELRKV